MSKEKAVDKPNDVGAWQFGDVQIFVHRSVDLRKGACLRYVGLRHDGYSLFGDVDSLPTGNWRKLTAEPATEASGATDYPAVPGDGPGLSAGSVPAHFNSSKPGRQVECDAPPITTPKIADLLKAVNKLTNERNALAEGIHDAAVSANLIEPQSLTGPQLLLLCKDFGDLLSLKYAPPSPPEVIEGKGQRVTVQTEGWYWCQVPDGNCGLIELDPTNFFTWECRFIRATAPTFPPRATFQAPAKPELVLVRMTSPILGRMHEPFWGYKQGDYYCDATDGKLVGTHNAEVIDELTGRPIEGGE